MTGKKRKTEKQVEAQKENSLILHFPVEITTDILSRIPVDSLIRHKLVCKTWRSLIEDPAFYEMHTRRLLRVLDDRNSPSSDSDAEASVTTDFFLFYEMHTRRLLRVLDDRNSPSSDSDAEASVTTDFFLSSLQRQRQPRSASSSYQHIQIFQIGKYINAEMGFHVSKPLNIKKHTKYWAIVGSSNGLICLYNAKDISVYNPCTNEYVKLPRPIFKTIYNEASMAAGFGYSPYTNEYKVVLICYERYNYQEGTQKGEVSVYTLGTGKWRKAEDIPHICMPRSLFISGVLLNRAIHWIMRTVPMFNAGNRNYEIVSFDLTDEKFRRNIVPSPKHGLRNSQLTLLEGCLCVTQKNEASKTMNIWVMNNKDKTWTMKFKIPAKRNLNRLEYSSPISFVVKSKILVCSRLKLSLYDTETGNIVDDYGLLTGIIPYKIKSFVSLKALGEDVVHMTIGRRLP